jgi:hypothetical protein
MTNIGIIIFVIGIVLAGIATISFRIRAIANKSAWGGLTLPCGLAGVLALIIGLILIVMNRQI